MSYITEEISYGNNIVHYEIPFGVRIICDNAFSTSFNKLETIKIPSSVNFIGEHAFSGVSTLNSVFIPNSVVYLGYACFDCDVYEYGLVSMARRKKHLQITIPPSILRIDGNPFCNKTIICNKNDKFRVIDNVLYSSDLKILYSYCQQSTNFEVPKGVKIIAKGAFRRSPIKNITLPDTLKIIEEYAFEHTHIENLVLPDSLEEIKSKAFDWCVFNNQMIEFTSNIHIIDIDAFGVGWSWSLRFIKVPSGCLEHYKEILPDWIQNQIYDKDYVFDSGMYFNNKKTELIAIVPNESKKYTIPEGVVCIRDNVFDSIYFIESIELPSSLKYFSDEIFDERCEINEIIIHEDNSELVKYILTDYIDVIKETPTN